MGVGFGATVGFMDADGNWVPVRAGSTPLPTSGGGVVAVDWADIENKPAVIAAGADAAAARNAIGAGTSNLTLGSSASTAKAGNYQPTWAQVSAKPVTIDAIPAALGTPGQILVVNAAGDGLEWADPPA